MPVKRYFSLLQLLSIVLLALLLSLLLEFTHHAYGPSRRPASAPPPGPPPPLSAEHGKPELKALKKILLYTTFFGGKTWSMGEVGAL